MTRDSGGLDADTADALRPDAFRGDGPYGTGDFVNPPLDHLCDVESLQVRSDWPDAFEPVPFGQGIVVSTGDFDQNGIDELLVWDGVLSRAEFEVSPYHGRQIISAYELVDNTWTLKYEILQFRPRGSFDLDGDGRIELLGTDSAVTEVMQEEGSFAYSYRATPGVRAEDGSERAWQARVRIFCIPTPNGCISYFHNNAVNVLATDLDGDGRPEIAASLRNQVLEWNGDDFEVIFDGVEDPLFGHRFSEYISPGNNTPLTAGDYDGDGLREVVFGTFGPWRFFDPEFPEDGEYADEHGRVLEAKGNDTFVDIARLATGAPLFVVASSGDVNGDGIDDLLIGGGDGCRSYQLFSTAGDDAFRQIWWGQAKEDRGFPDARNAKLADVDGDGDMEMAAFINSTLTVWDWVPDDASVGGGAMRQIYGEKVCVGVCSTNEIFAGDFDGDGRAEIVVFDDTYQVTEGVEEAWQTMNGAIIRRMR